MNVRGNISGETVSWCALPPVAVEQRSVGRRSMEQCACAITEMIAWLADDEGRRGRGCDLIISV